MLRNSLQHSSRGVVWIAAPLHYRFNKEIECTVLIRLICHSTPQFLVDQIQQSSSRVSAHSVGLLRWVLLQMT